MTFSRVVFLSFVVRPQMLGIMAGVNQKDRYVARCPHAVVDMPVVCNDFPQFAALWQGRHSCREAEAEFHGPVAFGQGGRCPCCQVVRVSQVQVVMMTVVIPQLHLVEKLLCSQTSGWCPGHPDL